MGARSEGMSQAGMAELGAERDQSETERNQAAEIARLKRKVADQAEELAIVKKAAAYFAKSLK